MLRRLALAWLVTLLAIAAVDRVSSVSDDGNSALQPTQAPDGADTSSVMYPKIQYKNLDMIGPSKRYGHTMTTAQDLVVLFGGCYLDDSCYRDLWILDTAGRRWVEPNLYGTPPSPRGYHSASLINDTIFYFGGADSEDNNRNDVFAFNVTSFRWFQLDTEGQVPSPRQGHSSVPWGRQLVVFGGKTDNGYENDVFLLNTAPDVPQWKRIQPNGLTPTARFGHSAVVSGDNMYIFGGFSSVTHDVNTILVLNLAAMEWTPVLSVGPLPSARHGALMLSHKNFVILVGGCADTKKGRECYNDTYALDTTTSAWNLVAIDQGDVPKPPTLSDLDPSTKALPTDLLKDFSGEGNKSNSSESSSAQKPPAFVELGDAPDRFSGKIKPVGERASAKGSAIAVLPEAEGIAGDFVGDDLYIFGGCNADTCSFLTAVSTWGAGFKVIPPAIPVENPAPEKLNPLNVNADESRKYEKDMKDAAAYAENPAPPPKKSSGDSESGTAQSGSASLPRFREVVLQPIFAGGERRASGARADQYEDDFFIEERAETSADAEGSSAGASSSGSASVAASGGSSASSAGAELSQTELSSLASTSPIAKAAAQDLKDKEGAAAKAAKVAEAKAQVEEKMAKRQAKDDKERVKGDFEKVEDEDASAAASVVTAVTKAARKAGDADAANALAADAVDVSKDKSPLREHSADLVQNLFVPLAIVLVMMFACGIYVFCMDSPKGASSAKFSS